MPDRSLHDFLAAHPDAVLVDIVDAKGSTPRDAGAFMLVGSHAIWGTIGGGQLEFMAIDNARAMLSGSGRSILDIPLGPEIGQCCGGRTRLSFSRLSSDLARDLVLRLQQEERQYPAVFLFGAGHVGLALAEALRPLPFSVTVVETRQEALQDLLPTMARRCVAMPEAVVEDIPPGGAAVILTHDHSLDFLIAREALSRPDLAYVGMIGSQTKRATFASWLKREAAETGLIDRLVLPIGGNTIRDKRPAVIAALVAAELLTALFAGPAGARSTTRAADS